MADISGAVNRLSSLRDQAPSGLAGSRINPGERIRCAGCGRFIGYAELDDARFDFTPLNEFGPEESEWVCARCIEKERKQ